MIHRENKLDLSVGFQVPTAPLGIYAGKAKSLNDVKDGSSVAAPNDPSNFARALVMLNELGWIKLKDGIDPLKASKQDIAENTKNIKIKTRKIYNRKSNRKHNGKASWTNNF